MTQTTPDLIAEYDARILARFDRAPLGSKRASDRQKRIDAIVNELEIRADNGDTEAETWFTS